mgnify:CR=1 FL=1
MVHPEFTPGAPDEVDLALLRFAEPLRFPRPIPLQTVPDEQGKTVTLVGWGYFGLGTTGRQYDDGRFRLAENRIEQVGSRFIIRFDDPREDQSDVTRLEGMPGLGDSGGPALLPTTDFWTVAGVAVGEIVDSGFTEETQGRYGALAVYERISEHLDWIQLTMATHGSGPATEPEVSGERND